MKTLQSACLCIPAKKDKMANPGSYWNMVALSHKQITKVGLIWAILMSVCTGVFSQEQIDTALTLPEVTINQSRLDASSKRNIQIAELDTNFVRSSRNLALGDVLGQTSDVYVASTENFSQDMRISIRGFGMRSAFGIRGIKLMYDGLPESTPDGQGDVDNIDPNLLESVKIFKGPANGLYSNASGGIIELQSLWPEKATEVDFSQTFASYGLSRTGLVVGMKKNKSKHVWSFGGLNYTGFREHSSYQNFNFLLKSMFLFHRSSLQVVANGFNSPFANDPGGITLQQATDEPRSARSQNAEYLAGETVSQQKAGLIYKQQLHTNMIWNTTGFVMFRGFENKLPFVNGASVAYNRLFSGGSSYLSGGKTLKWKAGMDLDYQRDHRKRFDNLKTSLGPLRLEQLEKFSNIGLFTILEKQSERWDIRFNARTEWIRITLDDLFGEDGDQTSTTQYVPWSGSGNVSYILTPEWSISGIFSSGFETPTLTEISNNPAGPGFADIKPARTLNKEIGTSYIHHGNLFKISAYHITSTNELLPYELPETPGRLFYKNAGKSARAGVEYMTDLKLQNWVQINLSGHLNHMYLKNEGQETTRIPGLPGSQHQLRLTKTWWKTSWLTASLRHQSSLFADDANQVKVFPVWFTGLSLGGRYHWNKVSLSPSAGWQFTPSKIYYSNVFINAAGGRYYEPGPRQTLFFTLKIGFDKA